MSHFFFGKLSLDIQICLKVFLKISVIYYPKYLSFILTVPNYFTMFDMRYLVFVFHYDTFSFRYRAIKHPMEYSQTQASGDHKVIFGSILAIWGVAVAVGLPILFGLNEISR